MAFVCDGCKSGDHGQCPGDEFCDCQHRTGRK